MGNEFAIKIDNNNVKELRCKNDSCRRLIGYENIKVGLFIFNCPNCWKLSVFNFRYREHGKEFMEDLKEKFTVKGGEKSG